MADYRKRLVDMTDEERAEVAPGAPSFDERYENVGDPLSVQMMEAGLDFTPVGTVKGISDIKDELSSDDPNYLKAIGMGAVEAAALIPGAAPVLKGMLRKGDALTAANKQVSNAEYDARIAQLDEASDAAEWQKSTKEFVKESRDVNPTVRTPELENSTMDLIDGKITREQHLKNVDEFKPVDPWDALPREPSDKATVFSLKPNQRKDGFFVLPEAEAERLGVVKSALAVGQRFLGRLDIPAYKDYDTWIVAGKSPKGEKGTVYAKAIHYGSEDGKPVVFRASQGKSENIGKGKADPNYHPDTHEKTGYATVDGIVQDLDVDSIRAKAAQYLNDPEWTQVGFDPRRQGGFYVRAGDNKHVPVREASEVIQIGPLVLARNAKLDFEHTGYAEGGAVMDKQMEMAFGDAGERVDPVSGNEVPTGSLPEEVRDDIPAQLSEGEYVVPADVVRYYGVKFFEDLRSEAKTGFNQMQANGRIGGEPMGMEVVDPQDDLDIMFDDSDFEVTDGPDGYAEGGIVTPTDFGIYVPETMEMREYVNAEGNTITIMFFNGMPMSAIPEGYTYVNPEPDPATTGGAVTTAADVPNSSDDGPPVVPSSTVEPTNYKELTPSELQALVEEQRSMTQDVIAGIGGIVNPILGIAIKIGMWHTSRQVTKELERRIADPENADLKDKYAELLEYHESDTDSYYDRIMDTIEGKERDKLPFDIDAADPAAINAAIEEGLLAEEGYSPDNIDEVPVGEVVPIGAMEPIASGLTPSPEPVESGGVSTDFPYTYIPYGDEKFNTAGQLDSPTPLTDAFGTGNIFTGSSDAASMAERKRIETERKAKRDKRIRSAFERAKEYAEKKRQERQREINALEAQISAKGSIQRDRSGDDLRDTMDRARQAANRNKASGLGAQTKKGSTAGSKSGYFD